MIFILVCLCARYEVGAVILHSPLMSGMRVAFPATRRTWFFDAFPSIDKVPKVTSPVLVIHGTEDEVIDFSHGLTIYEKCPRAVEPLWVEVSLRNDTHFYMNHVRCHIVMNSKQFARIHNQMNFIQNNPQILIGNAFFLVLFLFFVYSDCNRALATMTLKCTRNI